MATVQVEPGFYLQMDAISQFDFASPVLETATDFYVADNNGNVLDLHGSFTYNIYGGASGVITGGAQYYQGATLMGFVTGLDVDAHTLLVHLGLDPTYEATWQGILGGGDLIEGGNGGPNHLYGFGGGGDYIVGGHSGDWLVGYNGNNTIVGFGSYDVLEGFGGNNTISGAGSHDLLEGFGGNNTIRDAGSYDLLEGFGGNNTISGAGSHDWIDGGPGVNSLTGGTSRTTFAFFAADNIFMDGISNFKPGTSTNHDVLELHSLPGLGNFNQVKHHEFIYQGDVAIHDNIGDYILLENIHHKTQLHPYDFHFLA
jgi:hypothetical protein